MSISRIRLIEYSSLFTLSLFLCGCTSFFAYDPNENLIIDQPESIGVQNALKKAAQMKNVSWTPSAEGMPYNNGFFMANINYHGIPYSNVLAFNQHVFLDVSLETFLTAVHNPRSVLYTENVSKENSKSSLGRTYNGVGSACYYGSTCSYLITYSLGLPFGILASEFPYWDDVEVVNEQSFNGVKLADILSSGYHVSLVTSIKRKSDGSIYSITITENAGATTSSREFTPDQFNKYLASGYKIVRYKYFERNTDYTPYPQFVALDGETQSHYLFNDDLCPNYGEKSNYNEGETVIINVTEDYKKKGYRYIMVYKDDMLLYKLNITDKDVYLKDLTFGDYKVCLSNGYNLTSKFSFFKVVDMFVSLNCNDGQNEVIFASKNASPLYYDFCEENGQKGPQGVNSILSHLLTSTEISEGRAILSPPLIPTKDTPFIKVHFVTEYGRTVKTAKMKF